MSKPKKKNASRWRYVAIPAELKDEVEAYARKHATTDDFRTVAWACRVLIRRGLAAEKGAGDGR